MVGVDGDGHVLVAGGVPDERGGDEDEHDAEDDVAAVEGGGETGLPERAGDDDAGEDGDGSGHQATEEGTHPPVQGPFAYKLAGHGRDDARADAGE